MRKRGRLADSDDEITTRPSMRPPSRARGELGAVVSARTPTGARRTALVVVPARAARAILVLVALVVFVVEVYELVLEFLVELVLVLIIVVVIVIEVVVFVFVEVIILVVEV